LQAIWRISSNLPVPHACVLQLLGRPPRKHELDAWFSFLDFDRSAVMPREEFDRATEQLRQFSAQPQQPRMYNSFDRYRADHLRSYRVEYDRQKACSMPMTSSQEVRAGGSDAGWYRLYHGCTTAQSLHTNA
jgi:hypothetical protein